MSTPAIKVNQNLPTIALVGRVNVGKSTLFNRITETHKAIISNVPGTTRTRNVATALWRGKKFIIVDTGGFATIDDDVTLQKETWEQTELGCKEADVIFFVADIQTGILPQEMVIAKKLRALKKPVYLVANKADSPKLRSLASEAIWYKLNLGEPNVISAQTGAGIGDLLDLALESVPEPKSKRKARVIEPVEVEPLKVALMGRPNVGKSSLFNKLIGEERVIVSDIPHTTREPHDLLVQVEGKEILFIDTAGIRKKTKVNGEIEKLGIGKSLETIDRADIILFVLDASDFIADQDQQLAGLLNQHAKSVIIVVNKWDTADEKGDAMRQDAAEKINTALPHLDYAPILYVSAKSSYRIHQIFPAIFHADQGRRLTLTDVELKQFLRDAVARSMPKKGLGVRHPRIEKITQIGENPPVFELTIKHKTSLHISYLSYLRKLLREKFDFYGAPIILRLIKSKR